MTKKELINYTEVKVRFNEIDSMHVVWHGHYIKYLEDGREAFGKEFGLSYMDFFKHGIMVPLIKLELDFKKPLKYGDTALVETRFLKTKAAKLLMAYTIYSMPDKEIVATANSTQVFLDENGALLLTNPVFYQNWKKKWKPDYNNDTDEHC